MPWGQKARLALVLTLGSTTNGPSCRVAWRYPVGENPAVVCLVSPAVLRCADRLTPAAFSSGDVTVEDGRRVTITS
jgi:hypothetical protein